jgi:hypothetical protein
MKSNLNLYIMNYRLHWQMTTCEQMALQHVLSTLRPKHAVEVGTYKGGSLQVLSHYCGHVDSIDIDPSVSESLSPLFKNVTFHTGNSSELLPSILQSHGEAAVDFVLIDGDHSTEGVRRDINALLSVQPESDLVVLMHDAFNPDCRRGILTAHWEQSPFVQEVEVDYIPGVYHHEAFDTAAARTMWGGFAYARLKPVARETHTLNISQRQAGLFDAVLLQSIHRTVRRSLLQRAKARIKRLLSGS